MLSIPKKRLKARCLMLRGITMFHKNRSLLLFLLPGLGLLILFNIIPFFGGIWYSVTDGTKANQFVGLTNYESLWQNKMFLLGLKNTMILSVICIRQKLLAAISMEPLQYAVSRLFAAMSSTVHKDRTPTFHSSSAGETCRSMQSSTTFGRNAASTDDRDAIGTEAAAVKRYDLRNLHCSAQTNRRLLK